MIYKGDEYSKGKKYVMPNRDNDQISPAEKDKPAYNLQMAQAIYKEFCRGGTYVDYASYSDVDINRSYAHGNQPQSIYENAYYGTDNTSTVSEKIDDAAVKNKKRKAGDNLNFTIQSPAPKMMDSLIGKLSELINMVSVDPTDKYSGAVKETAKWGAWADKQYRNELNTLKALMVLPQQEQGFVPENLEELNLYEAEGGFKPSYATVMEQLLKYAFEQSAWDEVIVEKVLADLVTVGFAAVRDVYNPITGQTKVEYINAKTAGVQYVDEESYRNPDYGFFIKLVKLSDLKQKGFTEEELKSVAKKFSGDFGNDKYEDPNSINKGAEYGFAEQTDKFVVPVFVVNWIDVDYKQEVSHTNRYGKKRTREYDGKAKLGKNDELLKTRIKTVREAHWIIDTELMYDYGRMKHQCRDGLSEPVLPIHMVKVFGRPIIPRLIPVLDLYMNSWMKFQQGIRMSTINGLAIDMAIINNINLGGRKMNPKDVLKAYRETGTLFFSSENTQGRHTVQNTRPIEKLDGGAGAVLQEQVTAMDWALRQIEELTGINPLSMGSSPDSGTGKAVNEYSIMGTSDILKNIVKKANILKSDVARNMCLRIQYTVKDEKVAAKAYEDVVGASNLELLRIAEGHDVKYGIRTHARPTQKDIAELKEMIALSLKNGRDGKVGITEADYVRFNSMINAGESLKRIAMLLGAANKKAKREAEEAAARANQQTMQGAQQLEQMKAQNKQQEFMLKTQSEIANEKTKGTNQILNEAVKKGEMTAMQALMVLNGVPIPRGQQQQQAPQQQAPSAPVSESPIPVEGQAI